MSDKENIPPPPPLERQVTQEFGTNEMRYPFARIREDYDNWIMNNNLQCTEEIDEEEFEEEDVPDSDSESEEEDDPVPTVDGAMVE